MDTHYSLITIAIVSTGFYLFTYFLSKFKYIEKLAHQRIWNLILLIVFIITALLGILLAVQVNYKLDWPWLKDLLLWHVNFGIGLSLVGLFHLLLNIKFYWDMFIENSSRTNKNQISSQYYEEDSIQIPLGLLKIVIIVLGITAIAMQIVMLREFMNVFYGNELVVGIILCNWMLLTGLGAFIGRNWFRKKDLELFVYLGMLKLTILPILLIALLNILKNLIFPVGSMVGIVEVFYASLILLLPFCMLSGFMFTLFAKVYSLAGGKNLIAEVYSLESIGSIVGGVVFNLILIFFLRTFESLAILLTVNIIVFLFCFSKGIKLALKISSIFIAVLIVALIFEFDIDVKVKSQLYPGQELISYSDTPYGSIAVTKQDNQLNCYSDNILLFTSNDVTADEENVHYGMIQHPNPKNILLISRGSKGIIKEILKYDINRIDLIEQNSKLIEIEREYFGLTDSEKLVVINEDPIIYVDECHNKYDVVLVNMPDPVTAQLNRFYTAEFFTSLKNILSDGGVVSIGILSAADYLSEEAKYILSSLNSTMMTTFKNVLNIPANKIYLIASERELSIEIVRLINERGIDNLYVNQYYIDDQLLKMRSNLLVGSINTKAEINRDFSPVSYYQQLNYWLSYFRINVWLIIIGFGIFLIYLFMRSTPLNLAMFTTGFSASAFQILLLISFQIVCGYMYEMMGLLITAFFVGLALGSKYWNKIIQKTTANSFVLVQLGFLLYTLILPLLFNLFEYSNLPVWLLYVIYLLIAADIGAITGALFGIAAKLNQGTIAEAAAEIYSFDLIGSAVGALAVTAYLIPLFGLVNVSILIGGVNLIGMILLFLFRNKYRVIQG